MKKYFFSFLLMLFVSKMYCQEVFEKNFNTFQDFLTEQNQNISKIVVGLTPEDVYRIMGVFSCKCTEGWCNETTKSTF